MEDKVTKLLPLFSFSSCGHAQGNVISL